MPSRHRDQAHRLAHIDAHPDVGLGVEGLAGVAAFSKYHFHRQLTLLFGMRVGRDVRLARLKHAAQR
jgi:AraC family transcriptional regulator